MLKAVFFDAVGTLIYLPRRVGEHYAEVATRFGVSLDASQLDRAFRAAWRDSPLRAPGCLLRADDDKGWWRALVNRVLTEVLTSEQKQVFDGDSYFEAVYAHFAEPGVWAVYPEVTEVLSRLRASGMKLGVISNFDRRLYAVLTHLELTDFFKCIIISSEVGADKPDPFIFECALAALHVLSNEAIHVGDDPDRDWGAEAVGLRVMRLERASGTLQGLFAMIDVATGT